MPTYQQGVYTSSALLQFITAKEIDPNCNWSDRCAQQRPGVFLVSNGVQVVESHVKRYEQQNM